MTVDLISGETDPIIDITNTLNIIIAKYFFILLSPVIIIDYFVGGVFGGFAGTRVK